MEAPSHPIHTKGKGTFVTLFEKVIDAFASIGHIGKIHKAERVSESQVRSFLDHGQTTAALLSEFPSFEELPKIIEKIEKHIDKLIKLSEEYPMCAPHIRADILQLQAHITFLGNAVPKTPFDTGAVKRANDMYFEAILSAFPSLKVNEKFLQAHASYKHPIVHEKKAARKAIIHFREAMLALAYASLPTEERRPLSINKVRQKVEKEGMPRHLSKRTWPTLSAQVEFSAEDGEAWHTFESEIRPASQLSKLLRDSYRRDGILGAPSCDTRQAKHTVNLARTHIAKGGRMLFQGLRHGVHCAVGLKKGSPERTAANKARATEMIQAATQLAFDNGTLKVNPDGSYTLNVASTSLVTPLPFLGLLERLHPGVDEACFLQEQLEAYQALQGQALSLSVVDQNGETREITLRPNIIAFNFGVNVQAFSSPLKFINRVAGSIQQEAINEEGFKTLFGKWPLKKGEEWTPDSPIGQFFAQHPDSEDPEVGIVRELIEQIISITASKSHLKAGNEPYKLPARVALLCHKLGVVSCFNCKSGKDRTGILDVEVKYLAAYFEMNRALPEPDRALTAEEKRNFTMLALNSGNDDLQRINTGLLGSKTFGTALDARFFSREARLQHKGMHF